MKWDGVPGNLGHIIPTLKVNSDGSVGFRHWHDQRPAAAQRRFRVGSCASDSLLVQEQQ